METAKGKGSMSELIAQAAPNKHGVECVALNGCKYGSKCRSECEVRRAVNHLASLQPAAEQPAEPQGEPVTIEWRNCIFQGPPPPPHASWSSWADEKPHQFVRLQAITYPDRRIAALESLLREALIHVGFSVVRGYPRDLYERIEAALGGK